MTGLLLHGSPVLRVVTMQIQATDTILADLAVAIVVDAFTHHLILSFALADILHDTATFVTRINHVIPLFIFVAHLDNHPIAIQVDR